MNSRYVKELAKKTHRGLEGRVLRGLHSGGRCFGYDTVPAGDEGSKRLVINAKEGAIVKRIFEMSASGVSLKNIAKTLNAEAIESPRPRTSRRGNWCQTAVRAMLKCELYKGEVIRRNSIRCRGQIDAGVRRDPKRPGYASRILNWQSCRRNCGLRCKYDSSITLLFVRNSPSRGSHHARSRVRTCSAGF
jgi:Recombinase